MLIRILANNKCKAGFKGRIVYLDLLMKLLLISTTISKDSVDSRSK